MLPIHAQINGGHSRLGDAKSLGYLIARHSKGTESTNFKYLRGRKARYAILFSFGSLLTISKTAAFALTVLHIFLVRAEPKMRGIDACRIVTGMTNFHALWNWAEVKFITKPMGRYPTILPFPSLYLSISFVIRSACPFPAFIRAVLIHLCPKTLFQRTLKSRIDLMAYDETHRHPGYVSTLGVCNLRNRRWQATTAFTQLDGIENWSCFPWIMPIHKADGFALFPTKMSRCHWCNLGLLPATAMAITVRDFLRGFGRGMLDHVVSSFVAIGQARDAANVAWRFLLEASIIAQMSEFSQSEATG
jgi:hypothetical protein